MRSSRIRLRSFFAGALAAAQLACLAPRHEIDPKSYAAGGGGGHVRVIKTDGTVLELYSPKILMDTMFTGWTENGTKFVGVPLSQVKSITGREGSPVRSALLVGTVVTAVIVAIIVTKGQAPAAPDTSQDFTRQPRP